MTAKGKGALILRVLAVLCVAALCLVPLGCSGGDAGLGISSSAASSSSSSSGTSAKSGASSSANASATKQQGDPYAYVFRSNKQLKNHYYKHGKEMGFKSKEDYEMAASRVATNPKALHKTEKEDGDDVYYLEATNEFVIVSTEGYIRTYFNPAGGKSYFNRQ